MALVVAQESGVDICGLIMTQRARGAMREKVGLKSGCPGMFMLSVVPTELHISIYDLVLRICSGIERDTIRSRRLRVCFHTVTGVHILDNGLDRIDNA